MNGRLPRAAAMPAFAWVVPFIFCAGWRVGLARADECDRLPPPAVTVQRFETPINLETNYSHQALKVLAAERARPGHRVLGLTRATSRASFAIRTTSYVDASGRWECSSPQVTVTYGYHPMTVYVASAFPAGSCAYDEIYRHELRHVKVYQNHLVGIERELAEALNQRFATGQVWRAPKGQTRMMLEKEMNERWLPFIRREIERVEVKQAEVDTPAEYARAARACGGEIERAR